MKIALFGSPGLVTQARLGYNLRRYEMWLT